jgi:hypothetical protein
MESPVISLNLPVLPGSSVSFPQIPTFSLSHRTFFHSSCISQSSNRICLNFTVSSTDLLIFIKMSYFRFSCTFPGSPFICGNLPVSPPDLSVSPYISLSPVSPFFHRSYSISLDLLFRIPPTSLDLSCIVPP